MTKAVEFLKKAGVFYLATCDGDQPRVRPMSAVAAINGKIYIGMENKRACFRQLQKDPKVELTAAVGDKWLRLSGMVALDPDEQTRAMFLKRCPMPQYDPDDGLFEVLYFVKGSAVFGNSSGPVETIEL